jgi:hypothetical protein
MKGFVSWKAQDIVVLSYGQAAFRKKIRKKALKKGLF